jgi:hypothetical protein
MGQAQNHFGEERAPTSTFALLRGVSFNQGIASWSGLPDAPACCELRDSSSAV